MNEKKTDALLRNIEGLPSDIIENVSYEDGMKIAEQYKWYERKIAEQQKQLEEIYELLVGDNGIKRYTHEELIDSIKVTNEQIAVWQDKEECVTTLTKRVLDLEKDNKIMTKRTSELKEGYSKNLNHAVTLNNHVLYLEKEIQELNNNVNVKENK